MTIRRRKLVGTIGLALFVLVYAVFAVSLVSASPPISSPWVSVLFYLVAGVLWVFPAGFIITWMERGTLRRQKAGSPIPPG